MQRKKLVHTLAIIYAVEFECTNPRLMLLS